MSREQASNWAYSLYKNGEFDSDDGALRETIDNITGADTISTDRPYLFERVDFEHWLSLIESRFPNYSRVRLLADRFDGEGLKRGHIGCIVETYDEDAYEVEFSDANGATKARIVVRGDELALL